MCGFLGDVGGAFSPTDLFAVGLGLDFVGAYLLGRGLLTTPKELARRMIGNRGAYSAGWTHPDLSAGFPGPRDLLIKEPEPDVYRVRLSTTPPPGGAEEGGSGSQSCAVAVDRQAAAT
jgi:hypothetical protein